MATDAETVLAALHAALAASAPAGVTVLRNPGVRQRVPAAGLAVLRDGDPGEPEVIMSPLTFSWRHRAALDLMVEGAEGGQRDARFEALRAWVGATIAGDRGLGGLCDWIEVDAPEPIEIEAEQGAAPVKAGVVGIVLHYDTSREI